MSPWSKLAVGGVRLRLAMASLLITIITLLPQACGAASVLDNSLWGRAAHHAGVEPETLYGIALQESGMVWPDGSFRPWPWTLVVNKGGRGIRKGAYRYGNRQAANDALTQFLRLGINNVDVGLMQVNFYWHGHRVNDPTQLLGPSVNVSVAADILKAVHAGNDVQAAVAKYHSFNPAHGQPYARRVKHFQDMIHAQLN